MPRLACDETPEDAPEDTRDGIAPEDTRERSVNLPPLRGHSTVNKLFVKPGLELTDDMPSDDEVPIVLDFFRRAAPPNRPPDLGGLCAGSPGWRSRARYLWGACASLFASRVLWQSRT